ncbi:sugar phosphate isomerase/epimerase family protein [Halopelagius fulvigenes]|uniref:Sugar phosphate isomerase/epimerase family protein n=1 Tax=Halopelagius fulvigenes TaxID=1198324 RepID=A0ABD5TZE3_9EURY
MVGDARTGFVTQLGMDEGEAVAFAGEAGFDFVELMMDGDGRRDRLRERASDLRAAADDAGVSLLVHLPFGGVDIGSPHEHVREGSRREIAAALNAAASFDAEKAVLHASTNAWGPAWDESTLHGHVLDSVRELDDHARREGVKLCVENVPRGAFDTNDFPTLFEETDASMTLDTGHARMDGRDGGGIAALCREYGHRISHVHLNDTRVPKDEHLPFGSGTIRFESAFDALGGEWDGTLSLEVFTDDFRYLRTSKDRLDELL